jgi:hypothetical protein
MDERLRFVARLLDGEKMAVSIGQQRRPTRAPADPSPSIPAIAFRLYGTRGWSTP